MSALPPKADIGGVSSDVRFVPKADIAELRSQPVVIRATGWDRHHEAGPFNFGLTAMVAGFCPVLTKQLAGSVRQPT
jgi:hypothetical protein